METQSKTNLRFFYNGIKASDGKLQKCWYSDGQLLNSPTGTITIYARDYASFSAEIRAAFNVENGSDMMTDYFEKDRIRVTPSHPLHALIAEALGKSNARYERRSK
ncbi:MAG TPA: hypothetical protein VNH18_29495 [Bryobacteraceae bacterium]|nr:hypothetical protein [Blastocatellia bacterium]HXJ43453.1 hypothetical protein [Bryobacteraceae bacterium]